MGRRLKKLLDRWAPLVGEDEPGTLSRLDMLDGVGRSHDKVQILEEVND